MMRLSDDQLCQFREDGFLIIRDFFRLGATPTRDRMDRWLVDELAKAVRRGQNSGQTRRGRFCTRLTQTQREFPGAAVLIHITACLGSRWRTCGGRKELLDVVEQILGPEGFAGHPVWNLRSKTPLNPLATVPWHRRRPIDTGAEHAHQPTAWIPLIDANAVNGTLQVLAAVAAAARFSRTARAGHRHEKSWYLHIADEDLPEGRSCSPARCRSAHCC